MKYLNKFYIIILFFTGSFLLCNLAHSQSFLDNEISVVEFNTDWNKTNHFKGLDDLKNCKSFNISLCKNPNYMNDFEIKQPTIVIYNNGNELKRYKSNIMFTFDIRTKDIQKEIDQLLFIKFN